MFALTAQKDRFDRRIGTVPEKQCEARMAYVNSRSASLDLADRIAGFVKAAKDAMQRRRVYNQTRFELHGLSDRDLTDLGLSRANISEVARAAAYRT